MATYGTDLVVLATGSDGEAGTWDEFDDWDGGGSPGAETENFIQGTQSQSQTFGNPTTGKSIAFDAGSDISGSFATGDVVMSWVFMGAPANMYSYASGGHRFGIGSSVANFDMWYISGDDRSPNPYGGWWNVAIDPTHTRDDVDLGATGNGGAYQLFGSLIGDDTLGIRNKISKGYPHAVDGMRMGRGKLYAHGTGGTFTAMATENDYNDVTNGYNRWGLFQDTGGGTFLWKGLMSLGDNNGTSTSLTFTDSNKTIVVDDCPKTYPGFNKIEITNASSSITWTNVSFTAKGTYSAGQFEMVDNATVSMTGCAFNNMSTFVFDTNATLSSCVWNGCDQITHGGADFEACSFAGYEGTAGTAYMIYAESVDPNGELDNCSFTKGTAATHAIEFDATNTPTTITLTGIDFSGYNAVNGNNDSALYFPSTTESYTVNLSGCTGDISYRVGSGGSVTLVQDPVTLKFTVKDGFDGSLLQSARVYAEVTSGVNFPYNASVTITGASTTATVAHTGHGLSTNDWIVIKGADQENYNGAYQITVTGVDAYTYTTSETVVTSPATGTITATYVLISGTTDVNGEIEDSWEISNDQPFLYRVRKADSSPYFVQASSTDTLTSTADKDVAVQLTRDE